MAWPITERTAYDEVAELATMSALAAALGSSVEEAYLRWHEWALRQLAFIIGGQLGITEEAYEQVARRFASAGI